MKNKLWLFPLSGLMLLMTGCGGINFYKSGAETVKNIVLKDKINSINNEGSTDIEFSQGEPSFKLYAPKEMINYIHLNIENGQLTINSSYPSNMMGSVKSKLVVTYPDISSFQTGGTGDIYIRGIKTENLTIKSSGTGDIECKDIDCQKLTAVTLGTGDIEIKNANCKEAELMTQGTGDIECERINAGSIFASTNGTGDIELSGRCEIFNSEKTGTGDIISKNLIKTTFNKK